MKCSGINYPYSLPRYAMTAGESKELTIPIYNCAGRQIDMTDMTARFAISDLINQDSEPFVIKSCAIVVPAGEDCAVLTVELNTVDTVNLHGQYIYQVTVKNQDGLLGVMKGILTIAANYDRAAILM